MADGEKSSGKKAAGAQAAGELFEDPALAKYNIFMEMRREKKVLENSLLVTLLAFTSMFFVVFPEFAAKIIGGDMRGEVIDVIKRPVIPQAEPEEQQFREVRTERRERNYAQVPDFARPKGNERIIEDITDLDLGVHDEVMDDLMLGELPGSAPGPILVAGDIDPPVFIPRVPKRYPKKAEILRREGSVRISVVIAENGLLEEITVIWERPPDFGFGEAALEYLRGGEWRPARQNGKPIYARHNFTFEFELNK